MKVNIAPETPDLQPFGSLEGGDAFKCGDFYYLKIDPKTALLLSKSQGKTTTPVGKIFFSDSTRVVPFDIEITLTRKK